MAESLIVLVGHCGPDSYALRSAVGRAAPGARVVSADDSASLAAHLPNADLLLVNRLLEGGTFQTHSGIELIASLTATAATPCMLISNLADAQAEAEAAGALPGFGKAQMYSDEARERIRTALAVERPS
jgi:two-component system, chemotaxis family, chemotaxis protein CheY